VGSLGLVRIDCGRGWVLLGVKTWRCSGTGGCGGPDGPVVDASWEACCLLGTLWACWLELAASGACTRMPMISLCFQKVRQVAKD